MDDEELLYGFIEAFESIVHYDGHKEWLKELAEKISKEESFSYKCPFEEEELHTEEHILYMMLVGIFGDWGTSIRFGWIDRKEECVSFINRVLNDLEE